MRETTLRVLALVAAVIPFSPGLSAKPLEFATIGPQKFKASKLIIEDFAGTLTIDTHKERGLDLTIVGDQEQLEKIKVVNGKGRLLVRRKEPPGAESRWGRWFEWMRSTEKKFAKMPALTVLVPRGTPVELHNVYARISVGDTAGPVAISGPYIDGVIGEVLAARIELLGDGNLALTQVNGAFNLSIFGSGRVVAGAVGPSSVKIAGSGEVKTGDVDGPLSVSISGSGNVRTESVKGATSLSMDGDGNVRIDRGRAAPFKVAINGKGGVHFPGLAVNPDIRVHGRGDVTIGLYEGKLNFTGLDQVEVIGTAVE